LSHTTTSSPRLPFSLERGQRQTKAAQSHRGTLIPSRASPTGTRPFGPAVRADPHRGRKGHWPPGDARLSTRASIHKAARKVKRKTAPAGLWNRSGTIPEQGAARVPDCPYHQIIHLDLAPTSPPAHACTHSRQGHALVCRPERAL